MLSVLSDRFQVKAATLASRENLIAVDRERGELR